jgi:hypothetical protein
MWEKCCALSKLMRSQNLGPLEYSYQYCLMSKLAGENASVPGPQALSRPSSPSGVLSYFTFLDQVHVNKTMNNEQCLWNQTNSLYSVSFIHILILSLSGILSLSLGIETRPSHLLGKGSTTWAVAPITPHPFFVCSTGVYTQCLVLLVCF